MTGHTAAKDAAKVECNWARCYSSRLGKCFAWCKCRCHSTRLDTWQVEDAAPESSWNYRVTRTKVDGEYVFEVREVHYTYGQPHSWSRDPIAPHGESWHELADDLVKMQRAVSVPVLDLTGDKPRDMTLPEMVRSRPIPPGSTEAPR